MPQAGGTWGPGGDASHLQRAVKPQGGAAQRPGAEGAGSTERGPDRVWRRPDGPYEGGSTSLLCWVPESQGESQTGLLGRRWLHSREMVALLSQHIRVSVLMYPASNYVRPNPER